MIHLPRTRAGEVASAAVEFALVLPLLLVMVLALLQVGLSVKDQLVVVGAARAGAREAAVSRDDDQVRRATAAAGPSLDQQRLQITVTREAEPGTAVAVTVRYESQVLVPLVAWLFPAAIPLEATSVFRQEV